MRFEYREKSQSIIDTWNGKIYAGGRVLCDLLNDLDEKYIDEFSLCETLQQELQRVEEENKQLKEHNNKLMTQPLLFDVQTIPNTMEIMEANTQLEEENEQLKQFINDLYQKYEDAHGMSIENTEWF